MSIRTAVHRFIQNGRALLHSFRNTECFYSNYHLRNYHDKIHVVQVGKYLDIMKFYLWFSENLDINQEIINKILTDLISLFNKFIYIYIFECFESKIVTYILIFWILRLFNEYMYIIRYIIYIWIFSFRNI